MSRPLSARLPASGVLGSDELLAEFLDWTSEAGFPLYPAQEESILELAAGKHVILSTPTGSGKSLVALFVHWQGLCQQKRSVYTSPVKALVNEKFFALCGALGADKVGMMTGDATINRDAPVLCCTAEILANLAVRGFAEADDGMSRDFDYVVMDEFHYYGDRERGVAWQLPLLTLESSQFLLMSATLGDTQTVERGLQELTGKPTVAITRAGRPVPLEYEYAETPLHETIEKLIERKRAPIYLVNFTQRAAAEEAQNLTSVNLTTKDEKQALKEAMQGFAFDSPYGKEISRFLHHGVGLHHAGLLPKYRLLVERLAQTGLLKVISGTDTLGVGVNIPLRTVLFTQLCKFDGQKTSILTVRDFHQIAGRAGRKGFDDLGTVVVQAPAHVIENLRLRQKVEAGKLKKAVYKQAPQKGFVPWDRGTLDRLLQRPPEPLESRFDVPFSLVLSALQSRVRHPRGAYGYLLTIIGRAHEGDKRKRALKRLAAERFRGLRHAGLVEVTRRRGRGATVSLAANLDVDFSLNHALSLYLLATLPKLDPESVTYAFDILSLVESILENPDIVLLKQTDKAKTLKLAECKAAGMEYEERMAELDRVEHPKPLADLLYATFDEFRVTHPWVGNDNVRPKSIAREILEQYASFNDYVRTYELERSEGVLLRYLSNAYRALLQSLPDSYRTEAVLDLVLSLRTLVREADSSLLDEWEALSDPLHQRAQQLGVKISEKRRLQTLNLRDPKIIAAEIRAELHQWVRLLAERRYEELQRRAHTTSDTLSAAEIEVAMTTYFAEHKTLLTTPETRRPSCTVLRREPQGDDVVWHATQRLYDPEGDDDWAIVAECTEPKGDEPIRLMLRRIGV